jgi:hypothetical protein
LRQTGGKRRSRKFSCGNSWLFDGEKMAAGEGAAAGCAREILMG